MGGLFSFIGLVLAPRSQQKVEEQVVTNFEDREEIKLAQLESYFLADDNQGLVDLSLYF